MEFVATLPPERPVRVTWDLWLRLLRVVSVGLPVPGAAPVDDVGTVDVVDNTIPGAPDVVEVVELVGRTMCVRTTLGSLSVCVPDPLPDLAMVSDRVVVVTDKGAFADPPAPVSPEAPD